MSKFAQWRSDEGLEELLEWARLGLSDTQIALNMGITRRSLSSWKQRYPEIAEALRQGRKISDRAVETALHLRATGHEYEEETRERVLNKESGRYEMVTTKVVHKYLAPDVTAATFWLRCRRPDKWRDKREEPLHEVEVRLDDSVREWSA